MASGLGAAASAILDGKLPADSKPILARRKGIEQGIADAKRLEREDHEFARAKKTLAAQTHQSLRPTAKSAAVVSSPTATHDPVLEKQLKKIATQGIVALFNAVRQAQGVREETTKKGAKRQRSGDGTGPAPAGGSAVEVTKDSFLDILRRGNAVVPGGGRGTASSAQGGASFLRDDYLIGKKQRTKDFGTEVAEEEKDLEGDGDGADGEYEFDDDEF